MAARLEGILETALYADDLDAAEQFYGKVLGLDRIARVTGRHVFFRCGAGVLLIFDARQTERPAASGSLAVPSHGARGPGHVCFRVAAGELDGMADSLRAAGIAIEADFIWPNGARSIYFRDPAGNSLECADPALWTIE